MAMEMDRLEVVIEAQARQAAGELDQLYEKLGKIAEALGGTANAYKQTANGINSMAAALRSLGGAGGAGGLRDIGVAGRESTAIFRAAHKTFSGTGLVLERLVSGFGKLAMTLTGGVVSGFQKLLPVAGRVGTSLAKAEASIIKHSLGIGKASSNINRATLSFRNLLRAVLPFYGIRGVFNWMKEGIELSSSLTEVQNVVENAFGEGNTAAIEEFTKTSIEQFGLSELAAKQFASRYQAMGVSMGITTEQVQSATETFANKLDRSYDHVGDSMSSMALNLTKLAADMASFYNVEQDTVAESLNAIYTGQTRPLRQYGIDLTQATLQEWANKQGIDAKVASMTQAEKTMLRYQYVMSQTAMIQGDFSRTSFTWANQIRMLKQNFEVFSATVGQILINTFRPLVMWLNNAVRAVTAFTETIGNALGKIFGWQIIHTPARAVIDDSDSMSDSLDSVSDAADSASGSVDNVTDSVKALSRTILGFDEINKLNDASQTPTASSGNGGSGTPSAGGTGLDASGASFATQAADSLINIEYYKSKIDSLYELGRYISDTLTNSLRSINWTNVYRATSNFGRGLADFLNGLVTPDLFGTVGTTISNSLNAVIGGLNSFGTTFDWSNLGKSLGTGIRNMLMNFDWELSATTFATFKNGYITAFGAMIDEIPFGQVGHRIRFWIKKALRDIKWDEVYRVAANFGKDLAQFLNGLITPDLFSEFGNKLAKILNAQLIFLNLFGKSTKWDIKGRTVAAGINSFFESFDFGLLANTLNTWALGIIKAIREAIGGVEWRAVGSKIGLMIRQIKFGEIFEGIGDIIAKAINAAIETAKGLISPDGLDTPFTDILDDVQGKIKRFQTEIDWDTITTSITNLVTALTPATETLGSWLVSLFGATVDLSLDVLKALPGFLDSLTELLNMLNALGDKIAGLGKIGEFFETVKRVGTYTTPIGPFVLMKEGVNKIGGWIDSAFGSDSAKKVDDFGEEVAYTVDAVSGASRVYLSGAQSVDTYGTAIEGAGSKTKAFDSAVGGTASTYGSMSSSISGTIGVLRSYSGSMVGANSVASAFNTIGNNQAVVAGRVSGAIGRVGASTGAMSTGMQSAANQTAMTSTALDILSSSGYEADVTMSVVQRALMGMGNQSGISAEKANAVRAALNAWDPNHPEESMRQISAALATGGFSADDFRTAFINAGAEAGIEFPKEIGKTSAAAQQLGTTLGKDGIKAGSNWADGLVKSAQDKQSEVAGAYSSLADKISTSTASTLQIHSPSKVSYGYGGNWVEGLTTGAQNKLPDLLVAMRSIAQSVITLFHGYNESFKMAGSTLGAYFKLGLTSITLYDVVTTWYSHLNFSTLNTSMYNAGVTAGTSFANGMKSVYLPRLQYYISSWNSHSLTGGATAYTPVYSPWWYANGGFPNMGELFWANEAGPEMVGRMGRKNVVANNIQITEGIKAAVIDGMMQVHMATGGGSSQNNRPIVVEAVLKTENDEVLARAVQRGQEKRNARFNTVAQGV